MWMRIHDTLEDNGIDTLLANPYKTKIIAQAKIKSDKLDACILSKICRLDWYTNHMYPVKEFREKKESGQAQNSIIQNQNKTSKQGSCYFRQI